MRFTSILLAWAAGLILLAACAQSTVPSTTSTPSLSETATLSAPVSDTPTATSTATITSTLTLTPTFTSTPTITLTPTITQTPTKTLRPTNTVPPTATPRPTRTPTLTPTITPTRDYPDVVVNRQANCRYGPGTAYLYRWGLYPGDTAEVQGRNWNGTWYWIKPYNLDSHCWASEIVFDVKQGDPKSMPYIERLLPWTTFAGPPSNVHAVRDGEKVTVTWNNVPLSEDKRRGYMIEANICQNGAYFPIAVQTDSESYTFTDGPGCSTPSNGLLYTAEKHGYSQPVQIPWP
jgi:hypothetical protein